MNIVSDSSNVERQHFLITAELRDAVMTLARAAVSCVPLDEKSVSAFAQLIALMMSLCIYWGETRSLFDTSEWRDILLQMMMAATMATRRQALIRDVAQATSYWIEKIVALQKSWASIASIRNALVNVAAQTTFSEAASAVARIFCFVSRQWIPQETQSVFVEALCVRDALVALARVATSIDSVEWVGSAFQAVAAKSEQGKLLLSITEVRDALVTMSLHVYSPLSGAAVANAFTRS